jgi:hypothetical protein
VKLYWQARLYWIYRPHQRNHRLQLRRALRKTFLPTSYPQIYRTCGKGVEKVAASSLWWVVEAGAAILRGDRKISRANAQRLATISK